MHERRPPPDRGRAPSTVGRLLNSPNPMLATLTAPTALTALTTLTAQAETWPALRGSLFDTFPYLLPCIAVDALILLSSISLFWLPSTHTPSHAPASTASSTASSTSASTTSTASSSAAGTTSSTAQPPSEHVDAPQPLEEPASPGIAHISRKGKRRSFEVPRLSLSAHGPALPAMALPAVALTAIALLVIALMATALWSLPHGHSPFGHCPSSAP